MNCPLVSVVIPVYNTCSYLDKMFDCLLKQTYQNWEAICIDDGSADSSFDKLQEYADRDSRLHVIKNEHSGVSETRNLGISMANGEYIFFFDSDDVFEPNLIEDCISFACQKNVDTVIYGYGGISEGGEYTEPHKFALPREVYRNDEIIRYVMPAFMGISFENINAWIRKESTSFREGKEHTALWRTMCNLKIIKQYDIRFNQSLSVGEDTLFTNEYLWRCKSVGVLDKTLYYLVQRDGSANDVNNKSEELMYTNKIKIINAKEQLASKIQAESGIDIRSYWQGNNVLSALQIAFAYAKSNRGGLKERYKKFCTFYCEKHIRESINTFKYAAGMRAIPFFLLKHMKTTVFIAGVLLPRKIVSRFI